MNRTPPPLEWELPSRGSVTAGALCPAGRSLGHYAIRQPDPAELGFELAFVEYKADSEDDIPLARATVIRPVANYAVPGWPSLAGAMAQAQRDYQHRWESELKKQ